MSNDVAAQSAITLRSPEPDQVGEFLSPLAIAFGEALSPAEIENEIRHLEPDRVVGAFDGDHQVGVAGAYTFRLTVPGGGEVGAAGVTIVGVLPTHTRRGILRQMMTWIVDQACERGEPVAILGASEAAIYQRFGFGVGTQRSEFELETVRASFLRPVETGGTFRFLDTDEASDVLPVIYDAMRRRTPGSLSRVDADWRWNMAFDAEWMQHGRGAKSMVLLEVGGEPRAYAIYRIKADWDNRGPRNAMAVLELNGIDAADEQAMWQWLLRVDLVVTIKGFRGPVPHPLQLQLTEPRRMGVNVSDEMWLRILDVGATLEGRTYRGPGSLTFELTDDFCPWNRGVWRLTVSDGGAGSVAATAAGTEVDIALDVSALSTVYLGGFTFAELARAGRVTELRDGGMERADALFATSIKPWNSTPF